MKETDLALADGRTLHTYDTGDGDLVVFWHHGTPNIGLPPEPLFRPGVRWVAHDRPRYGGSSPLPGRNVASAAYDTAAVADALGIDRFVVMGHSGGGSHALGCAALLQDRVTAAVSVSGLAPFSAHGTDGLDWFGGMGPMSEKTLRAAAEGRAARAAVADGEPDFLAADWAALDGEWGWLGSVVRPAVAAGPDAAIDDDLAYVTPWGFDPATITAPVLLMHGSADRVIPVGQGEWLAGRIRSAELRVIPGEGHISVLGSAGDAVDWLLRRAS